MRRRVLDRGLERRLAPVRRAMVRRARVTRRLRPAVRWVLLALTV